MTSKTGILKKKDGFMSFITFVIKFVLLPANLQIN